MATQTAYQYCTGAVNCFAGLNSTSSGQVSYPTPGSPLATPFYLGTCEQYPLVQGLQHWTPTYNDRGGDVPFDKQYFGDSKVLIMDLNKFIQSNIDSLLNFGSVSQAFKGVFKWMNGQSFTVWLQFTNFGQPIAPADMPAGEVYFNCSITESAYDPIGTRARKTRLIVEADLGYDAANQQFSAYATDTGFFSGLPAVA